MYERLTVCCGPEGAWRRAPSGENRSQVPTVLIRTPHGGPWIELGEPIATLEATGPDTVPALLAAVDESAAAGYLAAGYVAYEAAAAWGLPVHGDGPGGPLAWFGLYRPQHAHALPAVPASWRQGPAGLDWQPSVTEQAYGEAVARLREHIGEGNAYQLNLTYRLRAPFADDPRRLFASLAAAQGGPWSAFIDTGDQAICSASPELFFQLDGDHIVTRPMKGTRPRGRWPAEDAAQAAALTASAKDRAENVMIVDLMRNDLGRIARPGSVTVTGLFEAERYPAQWQMTSTVEADLRPEVGLGAIFEALFPAGSVTGAPKIRSMEILREVEDSPRGVYCGAIGVAGPGRQAHFNVAIRTVTVDRARGQAEFGVGSGIVWDSEAGAEFEECRVKAAILASPRPDFELLESLRWEPGPGCTLVDRHRDRMARSAAYFGVPFDAGAFDAALAAAVRGLTAVSKVRLLLDAHGAFRAEAQPLEPTPAPLRVALARTPVASSDVFLFHKTTHREAYARAEAERPAGVDTVLLWNERGEVTEGVTFNVVVELKGRRVTPPVSCGLLAGTFRGALLDAGEVTEQVVTTADLARASRVWLVNSVRGWVDAVLV